MTEATAREHLLVLLLGAGQRLDLAPREDFELALATAREMGLRIEGTVVYSPRPFAAKYTTDAERAITEAQRITLRLAADRPVPAAELFAAADTAGISRDHLALAVGQLISDGLVESDERRVVRLRAGLTDRVRKVLGPRRVAAPKPAAKTAAPAKPAPATTVPRVAAPPEVTAATAAEEREARIAARSAAARAAAEAAAPAPTAAAPEVAPTVTAPAPVETAPAAPAPAAKPAPAKPAAPAVPAPAAPVVAGADLDSLRAELATISATTTATADTLARLGEIVSAVQRQGGRVRIVASRETSVEQVAQRIVTLLHLHGPSSASALRNRSLSSAQRAKLNPAVELGLSTGAFKRSGTRLVLQNPESVGVSWEELDEQKSRAAEKSRRRGKKFAGREVEG